MRLKKSSDVYRSGCLSWKMWEFSSVCVLACKLCRKSCCAAYVGCHLHWSGAFWGCSSCNFLCLCKQPPPKKKLIYLTSWISAELFLVPSQFPHSGEKTHNISHLLPPFYETWEYRYKLLNRCENYGAQSKTLRFSEWK